MSNPSNSPSQPEKPPHPRKGLSVKRVNLDLLEKKVKNAIARDVDHLLRTALERNLSRDQANALVNYAKLIKELKKSEAADTETMTTAELEKLVEEESPENS